MCLVAELALVFTSITPVVRVYEDLAVFAATMAWFSTATAFSTAAAASAAAPPAPTRAPVQEVAPARALVQEAARNVATSGQRASLSVHAQGSARLRINGDAESQRALLTHVHDASVDYQSIAVDSKGCVPQNPLHATPGLRFAPVDMTKPTRKLDFARGSSLLVASAEVRNCSLWGAFASVARIQHIAIASQLTAAVALPTLPRRQCAVAFRLTTLPPLMQCVCPFRPAQRSAVPRFSGTLRTCW